MLVLNTSRTETKNLDLLLNQLKVGLLWITILRLMKSSEKMLLEKETGGEMSYADWIIQ